MNKVIRTERGWAGHFCGSDRCLFRRNTLLICGDVRIVILTVGQMRRNDGEGFTDIRLNRCFETVAFHAKRVDDRYWDADISKEITFDSPWAISEFDADDKANDMHEAVVDELTILLNSYEGHKVLNERILNEN